MPTADPAADGYALALEEARRALDEQERAVAHLSTRAGVLLSTGAIVTSFLGGPVLAHRDLGLATWIALAVFATHGVVTLSIVRPRREWVFSMHPEDVIAKHIDGPGRAQLSRDLCRDLALHMGDSADANRRELEALAKTFNIASVLLAIEVLAWVVAILVEG